VVAVAERTEKVRVGDRYLRGDEEHITIVAIDASHERVEYVTMVTGSRSTWRADTELPLPLAWVKTGSGPVPRDELCLNCETDEREAGQFFCADCVDTVTVNWAGLTPEQIAVRIKALQLLAEDDHG
jgi:hypothetical protein